MPHYLIQIPWDPVANELQEYAMYLSYFMNLVGQLHNEPLRRASMK